MLGAESSRQTSSRDPSRCVRSEERKHTADVVRRRNALERLHRHRELPTGVGVGKARHFRVDDARRDRVHANAARTQRCGKVLDQGVYSALRRCIGRDRADRRARDEGRDEDYIRAVSQHRQQLLNEKVGRADVDREQPVEVLDAQSFDGDGLGDAGIGDQNIELSIDDLADFTPLLPTRLYRLAVRVRRLP
jgi:hypothetical protein